MFTSHYGNLTCHPEHVTVWGDGVDEAVEGEKLGIWSVDSVNSKYAGLKWSMKTMDSLPFMSNVKCLLECLVTLKGPS